MPDSPYFDIRKNVGKLGMDLYGYWSYPAFVRHGGESYWLCIVLPTVAIHEKKRVTLFRPKGLILTRASSKTVVRYENFRLGHDPFPNDVWDKPKAMFPHKSIGNLTLKQFTEKEKSLLDLCERDSPVFAEKGTLTDELRTSWLDLIHPVFLPYFKPLAPEFVAALKL